MSMTRYQYTEPPGATLSLLYYYCCGFDEKLTPIRNLMCGARDNKATNNQSVWNSYNHKPKVENNTAREKKKREHKESVYPVRSKLT
jgi:hypothetical protein